MPLIIQGTSTEYADNLLGNFAREEHLVCFCIHIILYYLHTQLAL